MRLRFIRLGLLVAWFAHPAPAQAAGTREFTRAHPWGTELEWRFQRGDDPAWSRADFNDDDWPRIGMRELPSRDGVYWVRALMNLSTANTILEIFWWCALAEAAGLATWALWRGERRVVYVLAGLLASVAILAWDPLIFASSRSSPAWAQRCSAASSD